MKAIKLFRNESHALTQIDAYKKLSEIAKDKPEVRAFAERQRKAWINHFICDV